MSVQNSTVFYVDDNVKARNLLGGVLRDSGFNVITAGDPLDTLAICRRVSFDLALLDYEMLHLRRSQLVEQIHSLEPRVPIVMISGLVCFPPAEWLFVDAHFGRGTSLDDLLETLHILTGSKPRRTIRSVADWSDST